MADSSLRNDQGTHRADFFASMTYQIPLEEESRRRLFARISIPDQELLQHINVYSTPLTSLLHSNRGDPAHDVLRNMVRTFNHFWGPAQDEPYENAIYLTSLYPGLSYYGFCCELIRWMMLYNEIRAMGLLSNDYTSPIHNGFYFPNMVFSGCQTPTEHRTNTCYSYDVNFVPS